MAERSPAEWIDEHVNGLIDLAAEVIRFDTTSVEPGRGERVRNDEDDCQEFIGARLQGLGAEVERVQPDPAQYADHPMMPSGHHWDGRAMTLACLRGSSPEAGSSLILNGHIDVVAATNSDAWTYAPFEAVVDGGEIYGRGAADMKGGIAAMLFALEALVRTDCPPAADVWIEISTDEETNGMGTVALVDVQPRADAAIVPEPSNFDAWVACRGVLYGQLTIRGRASHAELSQPGWENGGAVNAITKLEQVLAVIRELENSWRSKGHPFLASPSIVPTLIAGGEFIGSVPDLCQLTLDITYLPGDGDSAGYGSLVREQIETQMHAALVSQDGWFAHSPLEWVWTSDYPPYELDGGGRLLAALDRAAVEVGVAASRSGLNAWHDAATLGRKGIPAISCGPGRPEQAHTVDERISVDDLVRGAKLYAALISDFCGTVATKRRAEAVS